ncbi:Transposon TX1 uncharacterized 149 kDa protein ORF 2 [Larimichthys crocea]|uniref:Transposon TX1 uncharacterized 149 kDa protein ORF 2 n=1 Tax=Larimichthys crocea TaxID=215358 RepID=A0A6G0HGK3_LARCR|nr:Transposon TX1 uncharacterized 149 kDa protein ORF 2 [Larimichthys crocea]
MVVLFLETVEQVNRLVETGITVNGMFEPVMPLTQPATKITLSNVPPFISDDFLTRELSRHGKVVSPIRKVSAEANPQLDSPLTPQELYAALQSMQGRKAPGIDGLTVEFYKVFWDILAGDILDVFNESLVAGSLALSSRRAIITLLPKKGNLQDIKNWRPVSLLCTDYKILSKVLANRLRGVMEQILMFWRSPVH